jgi:hypothetical protein
MSIADKLQIIAENQQSIYDAGYKKGKSQSDGPAIDPDKIITKTVNSWGPCAHLYDISEVPHTITVQLHSNTITNFSNITVGMKGKNLISPNFSCGI